MNNQEALAFFKALKTAYPNTYNSFDEEQILDFVDLWMMMFEDDSVEIVSQALKSAIGVSEFPPTIAHVRKQINIITGGSKFDTEEEAWKKVKIASSNSYYNSIEEFNKLDDILKELVHSPTELKNIGQMPTQELDTVFKSNFLRSYREKVNQRKDFNNLTQSTKQFIAEHQQNNLLGE